MKKTITAVITAMLLAVTLFTACGNKPVETVQPSAEVVSAAPAETTQPAESEAAAESAQPLEITPVETGAVDTTQPDQPEAEASAAQAAQLTEEDFMLAVSGGKLSFDMDMNDVIALLGDGYEYSEAVSCAYDGMDKTYAYDDIDIYSWPDGDTDKVNEMMFSSNAFATARGITVGSTEDELKAAYGEGTKVGSMIEYSALGHLISFGISDGAVTDVDLLREGE